jgi:hypothetical protein
MYHSASWSDLGQSVEAVLQDQPLRMWPALICTVQHGSNNQSPLMRRGFRWDYVEVATISESQCLTHTNSPWFKEPL